MPLLGEPLNVGRSGKYVALRTEHHRDQFCKRSSTEPWSSFRRRRKLADDSALSGWQRFAAKPNTMRSYCQICVDEFHELISFEPVSNVGP